MALITAAEAKKYLPSLSGSDEDTFIEGLITAADAAFAEFCGYPEHTAGSPPSMLQQTYTRYFTDEIGLGIEGDSQRLRLGVTPAVSVTTIHEDSDWSYASGDLVDSGDYILLTDTGLVILKPDSSHGSWLASYRAIKVVFEAGWATVPGTLKLATQLIVAHWFRLRDRAGKSSVSFGPSSEQLRPETWPDAVKELLRRFTLAREIM